MNSRWKRTDDIMGYAPKFKIKCCFCGEKMVPRYSYLFPNGEVIYGMVSAGCQIAYKCPKCGYHQRFNLSDSKEYIKKILDLRGGDKQHNPVEDWEKDERIKAQLTALGYFGG